MAFNTGVGPDTRKASSPPPPFGKKPDGVGVAVIMGKPKGGMDDSEAGESPEEEGGEEYGAKLLEDIDAVFKQYGADQAMGREIAGKLFSAVGKCLSGDSPDDDEMPMGGGMK